MLIRCIKIGAMKDLSILIKRTFLIVGFIIATILVSMPAGAEQDWATATGSSDLSQPGGAGLKIPLSGLLSLDLNLSPVLTTPSSGSEQQFGTPPIPISKPSGSGFNYTRFGAGFSFKF